MAMLPADWAEYLAEAERNIKRPANPPKRRQPRIKRMTSPMQRRAESQTSNPIKAIYGPESQWNETPTRPEEWRGTHEVGPGDVHNPNMSWRTGNATIEPISPSYSKVTPRQRSSGLRSTKTTKDLDNLVAEYLTGTPDDAKGTS